MALQQHATSALVSQAAIAWASNTVRVAWRRWLVLVVTAYNRVGAIEHAYTMHCVRVLRYLQRNAVRHARVYALWKHIGANLLHNKDIRERLQVIHNGHAALNVFAQRQHRGGASAPEPMAASKTPMTGSRSQTHLDTVIPALESTVDEQRKDLEEQRTRLAEHAKSLTENKQVLAGMRKEAQIAADHQARLLIDIHSGLQAQHDQLAATVNAQAEKTDAAQKESLAAITSLSDHHGGKVADMISQAIGAAMAGITTNLTAEMTKLGAGIEAQQSSVLSGLKSNLHAMSKSVDTLTSSVASLTTAAQLER